MDSENKIRLEAMLKSAQSEPLLADDGEHWDEDPDLLGAPNGVIDLRTGKRRDGRPEDRITLQTAVEFHPEAPAPRFERFLREIIAKKDAEGEWQADEEKLDYNHRLFGYTITGHIDEDTWFLFIGSGGNGKSRLLKYVAAALGSADHGGYSNKAAFSTFTARGDDGIPNDIAKMKGPRLVYASEANPGTRLNTARIKDLTGSEPISARFMRSEWFEFTPMFKLVLSVNQAPEVRDDSDGFWRRPHRIEFPRTFGEKPGDTPKDSNLDADLAQELEGILAWMVRGAVAWFQAGGLNAPESVKKAKEKWREESNPLKAFFDNPPSTIVFGEDLKISAHALHLLHTAWCRDIGEKTMSPNDFGEAMKGLERKYPKSKRTARGFFYRNIGVVYT